MSEGLSTRLSAGAAKMHFSDAIRTCLVLLNGLLSKTTENRITCDLLAGTTPSGSGEKTTFDFLGFHVCMRVRHGAWRAWQAMHSNEFNTHSQGVG